MENNKIITKEYLQSKVNIILDDNNTAWFKGCEVASILGYSNKEKAVKMHVDIEDKIKLKELMPAFLNHPLNSQPHTTYINESGLYCLVIRSKLESSRKFKRWVTKEVIPSIRKTGSYSVKKDIEPDKLREIQLKEVQILDNIKDAKLRQAFQDRLLNEISGGKTLTDTSTEYSRDIVTILKEEFNKTVDFSIASNIGKVIVKQYRLKYNKDPEKYMKFVNGNNRPVFCYTKEEEKDLIHWISNYLA